MSTVGVRLTSEDLVTLNRILGKMGYQTLGSFIRDIIRNELKVSKLDIDPDIPQRLISIEQKINLLLDGKQDANPELIIREKSLGRDLNPRHLAYKAIERSIDLHSRPG